MILAFAHPCLVVPDLEKARQFYERMFGFEVIGEEGWKNNPELDQATGLNESECQRLHDERPQLLSLNCSNSSHRKARAGSPDSWMRMSLASATWPFTWTIVGPNTNACRIWVVWRWVYRLETQRMASRYIAATHSVILSNWPRYPARRNAPRNCPASAGWRA